MIVLEGRYRQEIGDIEGLKDSILSKGLIQPITINEDNKLLAGGRRLSVWLELMESDPNNKHIKAGIPAVIRKTSDEIDEREVELFENIHRKDMTWSEEVMLVEAIHKLNLERDPTTTQEQTAQMLGKKQQNVATDLELAMAIGHIPELAGAKNKDAARKTFKGILERAAVKEVTEKIPVGRETFVSKAEKSYNIGDAIEGLSKCKAGSFHFAEVDPPYGIDLSAVKAGDADHIDNYNEIDKDDYEAFLLETALGVYRALNRDSWCIWWHAPRWAFEVLTVLEMVGFKVDEIPAIWYKGNTGQTAAPDINLSRSYEPFFVARKGSPVLVKRGRSNVFAVDPVPGSKKIHPTERPVSLIRELLDTFMMPGGRIICPFLGSGNTILAAFENKMSMAIGWDLSPEYKEGFMVRATLEYRNQGIKEDVTTEA